MLVEPVSSSSPDLPSAALPASGAAHGQAASGAYVMRGVTAVRAVDTYHLILAPTHACNLRCEHCYLPDHSPQTIGRAVALRLAEEWNSIAAEETPGRRAIFHIKGGEPLVYRPLLAVLDALHRLDHLHFMMTTNGTLFEDRHLRALAKLNEASGGEVTVVVSLDGATSATHEALRGTGTFGITMDTIRRLGERRIRTYLNCVIHELNVQELAELVRIAVDHGIAQINFLPLVPKGFGAALRTQQMDHSDIHRRLAEVYPSLPADGRELMAGSLPDILDGQRSGRWQAAHECVAGYRGLLYVKPNGAAFTCPNLEDTRFAIGNVNSEPLRAILAAVDGLYARLHDDGASDRFICMGERKLYEKLSDVAGLGKLLHLQTRVAYEINPDVGTGQVTSFCVSRNW